MSRLLQDELDGALTAVLGDMQQAVDQLVHVLETERAALSAADSDVLNQVGTRKQAIMLQLEQLDAERLQLGRELPSAATRLETSWARIVQALRVCQQQNHRNGNIVNQRLGQVRQALSILTGHAGESELYGRTGELRSGMRSQALTQA